MVEIAARAYRSILEVMMGFVDSDFAYCRVSANLNDLTSSFVFKERQYGRGGQFNLSDLGADTLAEIEERY